MITLSGLIYLIRKNQKNIFSLNTVRPTALARSARLEASSTSSRRWRPELSMENRKKVNPGLTRLNL
jgi:hypothetical protein